VVAVLSKTAPLLHNVWRPAAVHNHM